MSLSSINGYLQTDEDNAKLSSVQDNNLLTKLIKVMPLIYLSDNVLFLPFVIQFRSFYFCNFCNVHKLKNLNTIDKHSIKVNNKEMW